MSAEPSPTPNTDVVIDESHTQDDHNSSNDEPRPSSSPSSSTMAVAAPDAASTDMSSNVNDGVGDDSTHDTATATATTSAPQTPVQETLPIQENHDQQTPAAAEGRPSSSSSSSSSSPSSPSADNNGDDGDVRIEREGEVGGSERRETAGNGGEEEEEDKSWQIDITQLLEMRQPKSNLRKAKKKVRRFYKKQNATISGFEQMHLFADRMERMNTRQRRKMQEKQKRAYRYERVGQVDDDGDGDGPGGDVEMQEFGSESDNTSGDDDGDDDDDTDDDEKDLLKHLEEEEDEKIAFWGKLAVQLSFWCNVLLLLLKLAAALVTGSLSIISSTLDSSLDLLSGLILYLTNVYRNRRSKKDIYSWPLGKSRFEPLGFIMFATVMCTASLMVVLEGVLELVTGVWSMYISPPSAAYQECMKLAQEEENKLMTEIFFYVGIGVMVFTIVVKSILFIICTLVHRGSPTVKAYAMDHRNDVLSNAILLVAIILAHYVSFLWWTDPFGAICLSLFIVQSWMRASWQQVVKIVGKNAPPEFLQKLTYLAYNHDPRIQHIDTVYAFYIGQNLFVEVDIVMDQNTILKGMLSNIMMRSSSQFNALFV